MPSEADVRTLASSPPSPSPLTRCRCRLWQVRPRRQEEEEECYEEKANYAGHGIPDNRVDSVARGR